MIELMVWIFIVATLAASGGVVLGAVLAGERSFEAGRQYGHAQARKNLPDRSAV